MLSASLPAESSFLMENSQVKNQSFKSYIKMRFDRLRKLAKEKREDEQNQFLKLVEVSSQSESK